MTIQKLQVWTTRCAHCSGRHRQLILSRLPMGQQSRSHPLFLASTRLLPLAYDKVGSCQRLCLRTPVQARLNTAAKSLLVTAALLCVPLIPKFQDRVPPTYRRSLPHAVGIALVGAGVASRASDHDDDGDLGVEQGENEGGKKVKIENIAEEKGTQLREAFSSSRAEWGDDTMTEGPKSTTHPYSAKQSRVAKPELEDMKEESLKIVSGGELMNRVARVPGFVVGEVVIPVCEVGSVLWYDLKMAVLERVGREDRYFMERDATMLSDDEYQDEEEEEKVELSVEERQMLEMQDNVKQATKKIHGAMLRLFGNIF